MILLCIFVTAYGVSYIQKMIQGCYSISWDGFDNLKIWKGYSLYEYIGEHLGYRLVVRTVELKPIRRGRAEFMFEMHQVTNIYVLSFEYTSCIFYIIPLFGKYENRKFINSALSQSAVPARDSFQESYQY